MSRSGGRQVCQSCGIHHRGRFVCKARTMGSNRAWTLTPTTAEVVELGKACEHCYKSEKLFLLEFDDGAQLCTNCFYDRVFLGETRPRKIHPLIELLNRTP